jgi:multisubunit Na+/H+ antiporter MnhG subunit
MRPWIIVLTSAISAIFAAAALVEPELSNSTSSDLWVVVRPHIPMLAVAAFGIYALCAMLLTTGALVAETLFVRHRFGRSSAHRIRTRRDWPAALGSTGLHRLASGLITEPTQSEGEDSTILLTAGFHLGPARGEIGRLHYLWLARSHFFSAVIVLTALAGLGLAQDHRSVPSALGTIPTVSAILILAGLILLAILGRIALDVSAEPLIEAISQMPTEPLEVMLLRRAVELTEVTRASEETYDGTPKPTLQLTERLEAAIKEGHRPLLDSIRHLVAITDTLGATLRSSIDALNSTISTSITPLQSITERDRIAPGLTELQGAVEALTAMLERLTTTSAIAEEPSRSGDVARNGPRGPQLARELRQLLQEIGEVR